MILLTGIITGALGAGAAWLLIKQEEGRQEGYEEGYRAGLERGEAVAKAVAAEYPETIFRPVLPGEATHVGFLADRIGAHMTRSTARNLAVALRREIEGLRP